MRGLPRYNLPWLLMKVSTAVLRTSEFVVVEPPRHRPPTPRQAGMNHLIVRCTSIVHFASSLQGVVHPRNSKRNGATQLTTEPISQIHIIVLRSLHTVIMALVFCALAMLGSCVSPCRRDACLLVHGIFLFCRLWRQILWLLV
jgi:hypothetical protein